MGWTDSGYGVVTENIRWRDDAAKIFYRWADEGQTWFLERAREYAADFEDGEWPSEEAMFSDFLSDYENEQLTASGIEAAIVDFINEKCFDGREVFRYEDMCIYVAAYIPANEADKANHPTQKQIEDILSTWLNPLLEEPAEIGWHDISFY